MKNYDTEQDYDIFPEEGNYDFDTGNEDYGRNAAVEEEYDGDAYNFYPDAAV